MLTLELDHDFHLQFEPGYEHAFTAAFLMKHASTIVKDPQTGQTITDPLANRSLWSPPGMGLICLKPLQFFPEFLDDFAQLEFGTIIRLEEFDFTSTDLGNGAIKEVFPGTVANPWIEHVPATSAFGPPTRTVVGHVFPSAFANIDDIATQSELGFSSNFDTIHSLPQPPPNEVIDFGATRVQQPQNQGLMFRWWVAPNWFLQHQQIYLFFFAQYVAVCRGVLLELFEDVSPNANREKWAFRWRRPFFADTQTVEEVGNQLGWQVGRTLLEGFGGTFFGLTVLPLSRHRMLLISSSGQHMVVAVRGNPRRTLDGQEWDILRSDTVGVAALTSTVGQFQIQRIVYAGDTAGVGKLYLPGLKMDYTPLLLPDLVRHYDADAGSHLVLDGPHFPVNYVFQENPLTDVCPPPTDFASGQDRKFASTLIFQPSPDRRVTPQLYSLELRSDPQFFNNPATPKVISDQFRDYGGYITHLELSGGSLPGEGHATLSVRDMPDRFLVKPNELDDYRFRAEIPIQLMTVDDQTGVGTPIFSGYTERTEVQPLRGDLTSPVAFRFRLQDRWLLLERTFLREQRNWSTWGHITVVDNILRQCGIDTGPLHDDHSSRGGEGGTALSGGSFAEYPAGWDDPITGPLWNTPLDTAVLSSDNLEGNQLLGWKPTPTDTGASFIRRIVEFYSNWIFGFRADGRPYYLPYNYFISPSVVFHMHGNRFVDVGLILSGPGGLFVHVSPGTAVIDGERITNGTAHIAPVAPNSINYIYLQSDGTVVTNTTANVPPNSVGLGSATTNGTDVTDTDEGSASGRQTSTSPLYLREPMPEYRPIEPSGNIIQARTHLQTEQSANRSAIYADWASILNPKVTNYIGRWKWFFYEVGGAFQCGQLNRMAYIAFQFARRRRLRLSFQANFVPELKLGQVARLEGLGNFRILEFRSTHTRRGWEIADYIGEFVERGYGLPNPITEPPIPQIARPGSGSVPEMAPPRAEPAPGRGKARRTRQTKRAVKPPPVQTNALVLEDRATAVVAHAQKSKARQRSQRG